MDASATTSLISPLDGEPPPRRSQDSALRRDDRPDAERASSPYLAEPEKRLLSLSDGIAIVVGLQIGAGIFVSPSLVARDTGSEPAALLVWVLAGLLAWACASCYIEMGTRLPVNGGPQEYLAHCFGDFFGFLASWGYIFVVKPCATAIMVFFIADHVCDALGLGAAAASFDVKHKLVALGITALVTAVNCTGNRLSKTSTKTLLVSKIVGVGFIIVMGVWVLLSSSLGLSSSASAQPKFSLRQRPGPANYTDAVLAAMWAYSGWESLGLVGGELRNPSRNIPRVINVAMAIVIALSVFANVSYFSVLSFAEIVQSTTLGLTFSEHFLGRLGGVLYAVIICLSSLCTLNIKIFTAARLTQAAAERRFLPLLLKTIPSKDYEPSDYETSGVGPRQWVINLLQRPTRFGDGSIPFSSILFNSVVSSAYILVGDFSSLITFTGIVQYAVVFMALIGLLTLRLREKPESEGNGTDRLIVKVHWLVIPVASLALAIMVTTSIIGHPIAGISFALFCIASGVVYVAIRPR